MTVPLPPNLPTRPPGGFPPGRQPPDRSRTDKGAIRPVKPKGDVFHFAFNPESVVEVPSLPRYNEESRRKRKDVLEYDGRSLARISFTLVLGLMWDLGRPIEAEYRALFKLARSRKAGRPPPDLEVLYGPVGSGTLWRIDGLTPSEGEIRRSDLKRVSAEFSVTLVELEEPTVAFTPAKKHKQQAATVSGIEVSNTWNRHTVQTGDTLATIAAIQFGDASRWPEIAALNGIRDPNAVTPGQTILLPEG